MQRGLIVAAVVAALLTFGGAIGFALAGEDGFDPAAALEASAPPGLLPPIAIEGRKGWACTAERNATATTTQNADLPSAR